MTDAIGLVSFAVMLAGIGMLSVPAALIVGGALPLSLIVYGFVKAQSKG